MTPRDFCYWLQGAFEIDKDFTKFTPNQAAILKRHLAMTFQAQYDGNKVIVTDTGRNLCNWLDGVLDAVDTTAGINEATTAKIRTKLDELFVHAVASKQEKPEPFSDDSGSPDVVYALLIANLH